MLDVFKKIFFGNDIHDHVTHKLFGGGVFTFGGVINGTIVGCLSNALFEWGKSIWTNLIIIGLAVMSVAATVKFFTLIMARLAESRQRLFLKIVLIFENTILVVFVIGLLGWLFLQHVPYDMYCENIIDNHGMFDGVGKNDRKCHAGWYRLRYVGVHAKSNVSKYRYAANRRNPILWRWFRTLHSVEPVDGSGRTLPDCDTLAATRMVYRYRDDGLDVEMRGLSSLDCVPQGDFPLLSVRKWSDIGTNINMKCSMRDDANNSMFAPASSTIPMFQPQAMVPHSKISSYKVLRDGRGRICSKHSALPDHDGINRIDFEYADNDEVDLPYIKKMAFNAVNSAGMKEMTQDFNGHSIDIAITGNIAIKTTMETLSRNDMLWTNLVVSSSVPTLYGAKKVRNVRTLDGKGRVVKEEVFSLDARKAELLWSKNYVWAEVGETGVAIESVEFRDGKGNLTESPFYETMPLFQHATTNILTAARIKYERTGQFCDATLFGKIGTNVICRLRFYDARNNWRVEFRSEDGSALASTNRYMGGNVVAHEERRSKVDDVPFANDGDRLVCQESMWLDAQGNPAACPIGWAACKTYLNDDLIDDVDDPRFTGQVRRTEYLGPDGKICQKLNLPQMAAVREFDHDRYGRVVEIRTRSASNGLIDSYSFTDNATIFVPAVFTIEYDAIGRPRRWRQLDSKRQPMNQCETILTYAGDSRTPSKIELVCKDGTRIDITGHKKEFDALTNPQTMTQMLQAGTFGFEIKDDGQRSGFSKE